jgi:transmembrane sensor
MTPASDQVRVAAATQAAEWFMANQGPAPDHARRAAFVAWLKSSPIHIEEYLGVASVARDLHMASAESDEALESLVEMARAEALDRVIPVRPPMAREPSRQYFTPRHRWSIAAAAMAVAASVAWWMNADVSRPVSQRFATKHGEQAVQRLADGSVLHLNTDTAVEVQFDESDRSVRMEAGEAFFVVAHEDARGFRVTAGDVEILAVGTQFGVRLKPDSAVVTVLEGRVDVRTDPRAGTADAGAMRVSAGYQLRIDGGVLPAQSERVDTQAAVAWLQRKIVFERQPLAEVAEEFNRYGLVQFVIDDSGLRALPVSGIFNAYDTNSFIAFLESLDGVHVETASGGQIRVTRQEAPDPGATRITH